MPFLSLVFMSPHTPQSPLILVILKSLYIHGTDPVMFHLYNLLHYSKFENSRYWREGRNRPYREFKLTDLNWPL